MVKKIIISLIFIWSFVSASEPVKTQAVTPAAGEEELVGFLVSKWCLDNSYFSDCRLESAICGSGDCFKDKAFKVGESKEKMDLALYQHGKGVYKIVISQDAKLGEVLKKGFAKNNVSVIGKVDHVKKTITATAFKAPPPPAKSFFKGCL